MEKIIGWLIFFLGLGLILYSLYYSFKVFTGTQNPPDFFASFEKPISETSSSTTTQKINKNPEQMINENIQNTIKNELSRLLPQDAINKILNLSVFSIFILIIMTGGSKIASLGISFLKK